MTTWHADTTLLSRYASGGLDEAGAYSLEAHLLACDRCRAGVGNVSDHEQLDRMWAEVTEAVDAPRPGVVERGLVRLGVRDHVARVLAATPSLRLSWLGAEALALGFAVVAANAAVTEGGREFGVFLFLVVAALLPVGGVAAAYGPGLDPTYEVGLFASPTCASFGCWMTCGRRRCWEPPSRSPGSRRSRCRGWTGPLWPGSCPRSDSRSRAWHSRHGCGRSSPQDP